MLVEQTRMQKDLEAKKREAAMKAKLERQSAEEQRFARRLGDSIANKEMMRRQRMEREEQYLRRREEQLLEVVLFCATTLNPKP